MFCSTVSYLKVKVCVLFANSVLLTLCFQCRFSSEEKTSRNPYYYQPFGTGPRNCLAMRLALLEMKMAFVYILQKFRLKVCEETEVITLHLSYVVLTVLLDNVAASLSIGDQFTKLKSQLKT